MGFCLAEMGFNLVIPNSPAAFASSLPSLEVFGLSFVFVSVLWWFHHKLFLTYFVLNLLTVVLNFVMLGSLALAIYFEQAAVKFILGDKDWTMAGGYWMASLAVVYGVVAVQYAIGIAHRRATLSVDDLRWGVNRTFRTVVPAVAFAALAVALPLIGHVRGALYVVVVVFAILLASRRIFVPKIVARLLAGRSA
jgi:uncharacterized membrane protein